VRHLRTHSGVGLGNLAGFLVSVLVAVVYVEYFLGGLSNSLSLEFLWLLGAFAVLGAVLMAVLTSEPVRRLAVRRKGAAPLVLSIDQGGLTVLIGKSPLSYPWSKVRAVDETPDYLFIVLPSMCYAVPQSAFANPLESAQFASAIRRFLRS
jgi:hypothetical protein